MRRLLLAATILLAMTPAMARQRCDTRDFRETQPGLTVEFHFGFGEVNDPQMDEQLHQMELKRRYGIDARSVRTVGDGCLEAFVQSPDGSWHNEYFDPDDYKRMN